MPQGSRQAETPAPYPEWSSSRLDLSPAFGLERRRRSFHIRTDYGAATPVVRRSSERENRRSDGIRHLHDHLLGAGRVHLLSASIGVGPADGPRTSTG